MLDNRRSIVAHMEELHHILLIATIAGGGGDIAFAANLLGCLPLGIPISLLLCKQAGGSAASALDELRSFNTDTRFVTVCTSTRGPHDTLLNFNRLEGSATSVAELIPSVIIQAPLRLFPSIADARAKLALVGYTALGSSAAPIRLVTLREFGQSSFCAASSQFDVDLSSGLGASELGVFQLRDMRRSAAATLGTPYFVGYFRNPRHSAQFALAVVSALTSLPLRELAHNSRFSGCTHVVWLAAAAVPAEDSVTRSLISALQRHPAVASVDTTQSSSTTDAHAAAEADSLARIALTMHDHRVIHLHVRRLPRLPMRKFRILLRNCAGAVVTGDATLNEALTAGVPFWYSPEGHKAAVRASLDDLAQWRCGTNFHDMCLRGACCSRLEEHAEAVLAAMGCVTMATRGAFNEQSRIICNHAETATSAATGEVGARRCDCTTIIETACAVVSSLWAFLAAESVECWEALHYAQLRFMTLILPLVEAGVSGCPRHSYNTTLRTASTCDSHHSSCHASTRNSNGNSAASMCDKDCVVASTSDTGTGTTTCDDIGTNATASTCNNGCDSDNAKGCPCHLSGTPITSQARSSGSCGVSCHSCHALPRTHDDDDTSSAAPTCDDIYAFARTHDTVLTAAFAVWCCAVMRTRGTLDAAITRIVMT